MREHRGPTFAGPGAVAFLIVLDLVNRLVQGGHKALLARLIGHVAFQLCQDQRSQEGVDMGSDFTLELRVADLRDVERIAVRFLNVLADKSDSPSDILGVLPLLGGVAGAHQRQRGDTGVSHVGWVGHLGAFDAAAALIGLTPAAALAPATVFVLLADEVVQSLFHRAAKRLGRPRLPKRSFEGGPPPGSRLVGACDFLGVKRLGIRVLCLVVFRSDRDVSALVRRDRCWLALVPLEGERTHEARNEDDAAGDDGFAHGCSPPEAQADEDPQMRRMVATDKGEVYRETAELRRNKIVKTWWIAHVSLGEPHSPIHKTHKGACSFARFWDYQPEQTEAIAIANQN